MRVFVVVVCLLLTFASASSEVRTPHVRVVYQDAALQAYAERVAAQAERALAVLTPLFGAPEDVITVHLRDDTDLYNAFATPVPHPFVEMPALFPVSGVLGFGAEDEVFLLVLHELTHLAQFGYTAVPDGAATGLELGLVGEGVARVPPAWFIEGIATWLESEYAGGRRDDPTTRALQRTLALSQGWPSLSEVSIGVLERWPGGAARYLLGVGFVEFLVERYGFDALLATLRHYNAGGVFGTFADAWREAVGSELGEAWAAWRATLQNEARALGAASLASAPAERLTESGWLTGSAALSPDGARLAWIAEGARLMVGELGAQGIQNAQQVISERAPERLAWQDDDTLIYNRRVRRAGSEYLELFALELSSARERQLTEGARAHLPSPTPDGCILYLEDTPAQGSRLVRWCAGELHTLYRAPAPWHLVGLATSPAGRIALSVWRAGQVDLALLDENGLHFLTDDAAADLEPRWQGETQLLFTSDRLRKSEEEPGIFEIYRLTLGGGLERLTGALGGAREGVALGAWLLYRGLSEDGYDLYRTPLEPLESLPHPTRPAAPTAAQAAKRAPASAPLRASRYDPLPSLAPYGWLPSEVSLGPAGPSFALSLFGQDALAEHAYTLTAGYAAGLAGPLGGFHAELRYTYHSNALLSPRSAPYPLGFGVALGLWPYAPHLLPAREIAWGARGWLELTLPLDHWTLYGALRTGALQPPSREGWKSEGGLSFTLSRLRGDPWSYPTRGQRFGVRALTTPTPTGRSDGAWLEADHYQSLGLGGVPGTLELSARLGYRPAPPVPVALEPWAALVSAGFRASLPTPLRYGDGLYGLERLSVTPRLRLYWDGSLGLAADVDAYLDLLVSYTAPVSVGVSAGYAEGFWARAGFRLPF